jgi:predicted RNA-binding Zn-ribbon protein involved in translation (DUF1610 family)
MESSPLNAYFSDIQMVNNYFSQRSRFLSRGSFVYLEGKQDRRKLIRRAPAVIPMKSRERQFGCTNCGTTVLVEFGAYSGGPLAYDDFAKCPSCGKEYSDQAEIARLVAARRARDKSLQTGTGQ